MAYDNILLQQPEPGVYLLTVNRPSALNALDRKTICEIGAALDEVCADDSARVLMLTGGGEKAFVAGADVKEMQPLSGHGGREFGSLFQGVIRRIELLRIPVFAVVNGFCLGGGCELALGCDWIVASESATFGLPEVTLGVIPGGGGTQRLARRVGVARAMELAVTGRFVKADEARAIGLANSVHPKEALLDEAMKTAAKIASNGPLSVQYVKEAIKRGADMDLDNACAFEKELFGLSFATADQKEGMAAFIEKRKPSFTCK